jgi:hypothetical protein
MKIYCSCILAKTVTVYGFKDRLAAEAGKGIA